MRLQASLLIVAVSLIAGCNVQTGISPTESVITKSSDRNFDFAGTWIPMSDEDFPDKDDSYEMTIRNDGEYSVVFRDASGKLEDELNVEFRTHAISKDHPHAIVEIDYRIDGKVAYRRLAIAAVKKDLLNLWMIDGKKIGKLLYEDGVPAVIEHFSFSSTVRCDSQKLLESLSKHSGEIVGASRAFKRRPNIGR